MSSEAPLSPQRTAVSATSSLSMASPGDSDNPLDLNSAKFDCQTYVSKLLKEKSLKDLLGYENNMVQEVNRLDAEMQQLIYENYNKFITATDTVRKMRSDFDGMEQQMDMLADSMQRITGLAEGIGSSLSTQRDHIQTLAKTNKTLKSLQFLYDVPNKLQSHVEHKEYAQAVQCYLQVKPVLEKYSNIASLERIHGECFAAVDELKDALRDTIHERIEVTAEVASAVSLLVDLGESPVELAERLLSGAHRNLMAELEELRTQVKLKAGDAVVPDDQIRRPSDAIPNLPMDVLEFVDAGCSQFLSNLGLIISTYTKLFHPRSPLHHQQKHASSNTSNRAGGDGADDEKLVEFARSLTDELFQVVQRRFLLENDPAESGITVRALDRFYRRIMATSQLLPSVSFTDSTMELLTKISTNQIDLCVQHINARLHQRIKDTRSQLVASGPKTMLAPNIGGGSSDHLMLDETLSRLEQSLIQNLASSTAGYLLDLSEQQFRIGSAGKDDSGRNAADTNVLTTSEVTKRLEAVAQRLLDRYVEMEGFALSQLLVKSVEARDWLGCAEPRSVRAVMKRVVEDLTAVEARVGQLFEEGARRDRSSDSSRRTAGGGMYSFGSSSTKGGMGRAASNALPLLGDSAMNSTLGKLWTERIDYFASVEPNKVSVMTGVVKIALKTLLESVRLRTFGMYGLQQVQVDCHYLQLFVWRFVFDEQLVHCLLDEVVSSAVHRCVHAQLMEPSVVRAICERG